MSFFQTQEASLTQTPETREGFQMFWKPPRDGERVLGIAIFRGELIIATDDGIYSTSTEEMPISKISPLFDR